MTPDPGYEVEKILADEKLAGSTNTYAFQNITSDHTIHATFKEKQSITCELSDNNIILGEPLQINGIITPAPVNAQADVILIPPSTCSEQEFRKTVLVSSDTGSLNPYDITCEDIFCAGTWTARTSWMRTEGTTESSSDHTFEVKKANTRIAIDVTSHTIKLDDKISVSGRFKAEPSCGRILPDTQVTLNILYAGESKYQKVLTPDQSGHFKLDKDDESFEGFDLLGEWTVQAAFEENEAYESSSSDILQVSVMETAGYGIVVQGKILSDTAGLLSHNMTTNFVYDTLKDRGLSDDDIMYFNYDESQSGIDIDDTPSNFLVEKAITEWARDNAPYFDNSPQHPLLDDNGDGIGSNSLSDPGDGVLSESLFIGVMNSATENEPGNVRVVETGAEPQILKIESDSAGLWARVDNSDRVTTIWCEIKPPNYTPFESEESGQLEMELEKKIYTSYNE